MACSVQAFRFLLEFPKKLSYMPSQKTNDTITEKIHFSSFLPLLLLFLVLPPSPVSLPTSSFNPLSETETSSLQEAGSGQPHLRSVWEPISTLGLPYWPLSQKWDLSTVLHFCSTHFPFLLVQWPERSPHPSSRIRPYSYSQNL